MKKRIITAFLAAAAMLSCVQPAKAVTTVPYLGYEYNTSEESVPAPVGYEPLAFYLGSDMGTNALSQPKDMCFYNNELYILDSGNSRIIVTDRNIKFIRSIGEITIDGEKLNYKDAQGIYVCDDGNILISDTQGCRIIECTNSGEGVRLFTKPDTPMIDKGLAYNVKKAIRDYNGVTYALVDGINSGAVTYMEDGSFAGFFASNEVEQTAEVILNYIWQKFMTEEQIMNSKNASPSSITNFDIAEKGFLYTVTQSSEGVSSVRLLNYKGSNIDTETEYGDLEWDRKIKDSVSTTFCDVDADSEKYVYLLDSSRGRVFVYSEDGYLITVFGGMGDRLGTHRSPIAIETNGDRVYVLDDVRGGITVYESNDYMKTVKTALNLLEKGKYSESRSYWEKVLSYNSNSTVAYYGIGLALDEAGEYSEALRYFKLAYENEAYSEAFKEVRKEFIKDNFIWVAFAAAAVIVGLIFLIRFMHRRFRRKNSYERSALEGKYTAPFFTMFHPIDGFECIKQEKRWSLPLTFGILTVLFLTLTAKWFLTGFSFNTDRALDYNVFITLLQAFLIVGVTAIANWAVCTLIEGKGKLIDIVCMLTYSLVPFIITQLAGIVFSNVLMLDEGAFLTAVEIIGIVWSGVLIFTGFMTIHQFSFGKTVLSIIMTVIGIAIIIFLAVLFVGLLQQVISFFKSVWSEAVMMG